MPKLFAQHFSLAHFFHVQRFLQTLYGLAAHHSNSWKGLTDYNRYAHHDLKLLNLCIYDYVLRLMSRLAYGYVLACGYE